MRAIALYYLPTLVIISLASRFSPSPIGVPSQSTVTGEDPHSVRFAPSVVSLNAGDLLHPSNYPRSHLQLKYSKRIVTTSAWVIIILLLAGDIELNPGPNWKYPCGECSGPVKCNQKGIYCDVCNTWLHTHCIGLSDLDYSIVQASPDTWACRSCLCNTLPFHNASLGYSDTSASDLSTSTSASNVNLNIISLSLKLIT